MKKTHKCPSECIVHHFGKVIDDKDHKVLLLLIEFHNNDQYTLKDIDNKMWRLEQHKSLHFDMDLVDMGYKLPK